MVLTRLAVLLATSLADCTNWRLAVGLAVRAEARRQLLHSADVCLATIVAADNTWGDRDGKAVTRAGRKNAKLREPFQRRRTKDGTSEVCVGGLGEKGAQRRTGHGGGIEGQQIH